MIPAGVCLISQSSERGNLPIVRRPNLHFDSPCPLVSKRPKILSRDSQDVARPRLLRHPPQPPPILILPIVSPASYLQCSSHFPPTLLYAIFVFLSRSHPVARELIVLPSRPPTLITIHPSVPASILTHHSRRSPESTAPRVIGTLLGIRSESGEVDVRSSFAVPHSEGEDQIELDMPFHEAMVDLLSKNGAKESIVGW